MAKVAGIPSWILEPEPPGDRERHFQKKYRDTLVSIAELALEGMKGNDADGIEELNWIVNRVAQLMADLYQKASADYVATHFETDDSL